MLLEATLLRDLQQPEYIHVLLNPLQLLGWPHRFDRSRARFDFEEPPRSNRNPGARPHQLRVGADHFQLEQLGSQPIYG